MKFVPVTQDAAFAASQVEMGKLAIALGKVQGRLREISSRLSSATSERADSAALNAALEFAETGVVKASANEVSSLNEERLVLSEQESALMRAMSKLDQAQQQRIQELGELIAADVRTAHAALAKRYVAALQELDKVVDEEEHLVAALESAGYRPMLRGRLFNHQLGRINDNSGSLLFYVYRDAKQLA